LLAIAHLQAVFALPYAYEGFKYITPEELIAIKERFPKKPSISPVMSPPKKFEISYHFLILI